MTVTDLRTNTEAGTLVITTQYAATVDEVWALWANPRLLERWWGPPGFPATVTEHDFAPSGLVRYHMTGPDGERYHGGWTVVAAEPPIRLDLEDYFADDEGNRDTSLPTSVTAVTITTTADGMTEMVITSRYATSEDLGRVLEMGMEEGIRAALGQIDALLVEQRG